MKMQRVSECSFQSCLAFTAWVLLLGSGCGSSTGSPSRQGTGSSGAGTTAAGAGSGAAAGTGSAGTAGISTGKGGSGGGTGGTAGTTGVGGTVAPQADGGSGRVFDAGSDPNRNKVVVGKICDRMSTIQCAGEAFCCDNSGRTEAQCKATMLQGCTSQLMIDTIAADRITGFDPVVAEAAFTHYEDITSKCNQSVASWGESAEGLRGILRGTRNAGDNCAPPATSLNDKGPAAAALASCDNLATQACLPTIPTGVPTSLPWYCSPKNAVGGNCFSDVNCTAGLYCDNPKFKLTGTTCKTRKTPGTACVNPNECVSLFCKKGVCAETSVQAAFCLQN